MSTFTKYEGDQYLTHETGHGRTETRLALVSNDLTPLGDSAYDWANLKTIGVAATIRQEGGKAAASESVALRYYIS